MIFVRIGHGPCYYHWNEIFAGVLCNQVRTEMEFSFSQTENFEMEKLSSDTGYFKKPVEINRGTVSTFGWDWDLSKGDSLALPAILAQSSAKDAHRHTH